MVEDAFGSVGRVGDEHGGVLGRTDNVGQCDTGFVLRAESGLDRVRTVVDTDDVAHDFFFSSVLCCVGLCVKTDCCWMTFVDSKGVRVIIGDTEASFFCCVFCFVGEANTQ